MTTTVCIATGHALHFFLAAGQGSEATLMIVAATATDDEEAP
jgi:hypothetical protein